MRIIGTGIDIVEIARIEKSLEKYDEKFAEKILHLEEISEFATAKNKPRIFSKTICGKGSLC